MSIKALEQIKKLHAAYCTLTGFRISLDMMREGVWFEWLRKGFTQEDLQLVVRHLRKGINDGQRNAGALKFSNLIGQVDHFEEDLAMARAGQKVAKAAGDPNRAAVLQQTGRGPAAKATEARAVGDVLKGDAAFKDFVKLKEEL